MEDKIPGSSNRLRRANEADTFRRSALRDFLRARRRALTQQMVGLPPRRRWGEPGLRLQDVAELAGVSTGWVTTLELGAAKNISPARLTAIATALRLDETERAYLFHLTGTPRPARAISPDVAVPPPLRHLVETYDEGIALLLDRRYDILAANAVARFVGMSDDGDGFHRNLLWRMFLMPEGRRLSSRWQNVQRARMVATLRRIYAESACDERLESMIHELLADSEEFARHWKAQTVEESSIRHLHFLLPNDATVTVDTVVLTAADGLRTHFFIPSDDVSRRHLAACGREPTRQFHA